MMESASDASDVGVTVPVAPPRPRTDYVAQDLDEESPCLRGLCACVGCGGGVLLCAACVGLVMAPCALVIYGIVLACTWYSAIPACAYPYRPWMIVMIVLLAGTAKNNHNKAKQQEETSIQNKEKACQHVCAGLATATVIPLLGYLLVVKKVDGRNNCHPGGAIRSWSLLVVYFYVALGVVRLARGGVRAIRA